MWSLIKRIFIGHVHKWAIIKERPIVLIKTGTEIGTLYVCKCEHCGKIKTYEATV